MNRVSGLGSRVSNITLALCCLITANMSGCVPAVSNAELERRVAASRPAWANYQEDIKAQIGARPVAEWQGSPVNVRKKGASIIVDFQIAGVWTQREVSVPVLLRDPTGTVTQNTAAKRSVSLTVYVFPFSESAADPAWVELKFPHGERRLILQPESKKSE